MAGEAWGVSTKKSIASFNGNQSLTKCLESLPQKRNFYAHQAYLSIYAMSTSNINPENALNDLEQVITVSKACVSNILLECENLEKRFMEFRNVPSP